MNQYNTEKLNLKKKIGNFENKISDTRNLVTRTVLNKKIIEVKNELRNHSEYVTTLQFNKLTAQGSLARLKQANLLAKTDFGNKLTSFNPIKDGAWRKKPPTSFSPVTSTNAGTGS